MTWKIALPIFIALALFSAAVRPEGCGGLSAASLLNHLAIQAQGLVLALVIWREEIGRAA